MFPKDKEQLGVPWMLQKLQAASADIGSCVVVRKDGKPLEPIFMKALEVYMRLKLDNAAIKTKCDGLDKMFLYEVSKEDWEDFFKDFDPDKDYELDRDFWVAASALLLKKGFHSFNALLCFSLIDPTAALFTRGPVVTHFSELVELQFVKLSSV